MTSLRSQSYLGAQYRRLHTRLGAPKAITAMARKLACLYYQLIKHGQRYVGKGTAYYEARYRDQQIRAVLKESQKARPSSGYPAICVIQRWRFLERGRHSPRARPTSYLEPGAAARFL